MRAVFVRHSQSTGNAGIPSPDLAAIDLTELGHDQARDIAVAWLEPPTLIIVSPYLRTQQTAAPTIARFSSAPVEVWPVEEFTYLQPQRWNGTRSVDRLPYLERYWHVADPEYCDGEGSESFGSLLRRANAALERLAALPADALAYVFSHGQFIQAVRATVVEPDLDDRGKMLRFWRSGEPPEIANGQRVHFSRRSGIWHQVEPESELACGSANREPQR